MFIAEALVPIWTELSGEPGLNLTSDRPVLIAVETSGATVHGQLLNLAETKALVFPTDPFLICGNTRVTLRFRAQDVVYTLSGLSEPSEVDASFELVFDEVSRKRVVDFVEVSNAAQPEAQAPKLKKNRTKAEQRVVLSEMPPEGLERRLHARHAMQAHATLMVLARRVTLRCHVLEVSFSGCRLFSESPIFLEEDTLVEVEFEGRGFPLRLVAKTKLKPDQNLVGLQFVNASSRTLERLKELIAELEAEQAGTFVS